MVADFTNIESYRDLKKRIDDVASSGSGNAVFYLAVADRFFGPIVDNLGEAGLLAETKDAFRRVIIEKPFGSDLPSAKALNERVTKIADESQIYRIDHFLGKEPVQSIMAMRFGNGLFEPMWRREHVDHVQITASETIGVEERGGFYEATGALRDMVPNHLFQLLTMVTMEAPNSFEPENVRSEKAKLVEAIKRVDPRDVVRGQYKAGSIDGQSVPGYRDEHNVAKDSTTETYAALRVDIEDWRWSGVPFYLRTGKRLKTRMTTISIHFKPAPYRIFRDTPVEKITPNVLTLMISPQQGMTTDFSAKIPGPTMRLGRVSTEFMYDDFFDEATERGLRNVDLRLHDRRRDALPTGRPNRLVVGGGAAGTRRVGCGRRPPRILRCGKRWAGRSRCAARTRRPKMVAALERRGRAAPGDPALAEGSDPRAFYVEGTNVRTFSWDLLLADALLGRHLHRRHRPCNSSAPTRRMENTSRIRTTRAANRSYSSSGSRSRRVKRPKRWTEALQTDIGSRAAIVGVAVLDAVPGFARGFVQHAIDKQVGPPQTRATRAS